MNDAFGMPQSVVILGGTSDIARAILNELVTRGCRTVVLAGRDSNGLSAVAEEARGLGATGITQVPFDGADVADAEHAVKMCLTAAGEDIDLVIVALGLLGDQTFDEKDPNRVAEVINVNFVWPAAALSVIAEQLRNQGHGRILVLSSVAGVRIRRSNYLYGSAKAGFDGYARGMAEALNGTGVQLQVVRPGFVHSKMTKGLHPAPFAIDPSKVATAVLLGLESNRPVIWVPAILRWVFVGLRLLPDQLWRRLPG